MEKQVVVECKLHDICKKRDLTIRDLAKRTGISETQLYNAANQGSNMRVDNVARIMVALDCDFVDLFTIKTW